MVINTAAALAMLVCLAASVAVPAAQAQTQRRTVTVKHAPIADQGSDSWSAQQNVLESKQYERLLRTNPAFRKARMQKECGSINDPQLHQSCLASFNQGINAIVGERRFATCSV